MIPRKFPPQYSVLLPDIRSGWNVGAFFRTADAFGVDQIFLCGVTPFPPHKEIAKTALGAENFVPWSYWQRAEDAVLALKKAGVLILGLECDARSISFKKWKEKRTNPPHICLIVGNEISGVSESLLSLCDDIIVLPMKGKKESLNVSIAGSVAIWEITNLSYH